MCNYFPNKPFVTWGTTLEKGLLSDLQFLGGSAAQLGFLQHTQRRSTVGRTPLDERSALRRDLYLTEHTKLTIDMHASGGIRTHNLSRRAAARSGVLERNMCKN